MTLWLHYTISENIFKGFNYFMIQKKKNVQLVKIISYVYLLKNFLQCIGSETMLM